MSAEVRAYRHRAEQHRPAGAAALAREIRRLAAGGIISDAIARFMRVSPAVVGALHQSAQEWRGAELARVVGNDAGLGWKAGEVAEGTWDSGAFPSGGTRPPKLAPRPP
jgi:hypothetical protein